MILGRVCGSIHSTINHQFCDGKRILVVDRLKKDGTPSEKYIIAVEGLHYQRDDHSRRGGDAVRRRARCRARGQP